MSEIKTMLAKDSPAIASIKASLETFKDAPASTDFQRGYEAALRDLLEQVFEAENQS